MDGADRRGDPVIPHLVVPTLTRRDLLMELLATIDVPVGTLLIVDNGDQHIGDLYVPNVDRVRVADLGANLGVAASWNLGIKTAVQHDWVMVVSDDVRMPPGALARFAELSAPDRVVVTAAWPHWCAFTIGMDVVQTVGLFDENYYPAYFEDDDFERRMTDAGLVTHFGPEVQHSNSSTLRTPGRQFHEVNMRTFEANRAYDDGKRNGTVSTLWDPYRWRRQTWT